MSGTIKFRAIIIALALAVSCSGGSLEEWTLQSSKGWPKVKASVPCTVAGALLDAGVKIDTAMFSRPWVFRTRFSANENMYSVLRFGSLNYSADIFLNGQCIASADTTFGTFIKREYDITPAVKRHNKLEVYVHKAPRQALNHGWVDWNPRPEDESMGILGHVELITTPAIYIKDVYVKPDVNPDNLSEASVSIATTLENLSGNPVEGILEFTYEGGAFRQEVALQPHERKVVVSQKRIDNPRIWWTREMGSPELYHLSAAFKAENTIHDSKKLRFGLRSITSEIDSFGHRLYKLNGREVLLKGAGWTDDRYMRDSHESIARQMAFVADMGLNCVRFENIWGKDDCVYELCDSLGIMALVGWSCQWEWKNYCGYPEDMRFGCINTPETEELVLKYFRDQVTRLRNHPSVIGWLSGSDKIPNPELEKRYLELYEELDYRPYQCSASGLVSEVSGPSGAKMMGPYEYVCPDYWYTDKTHGGNYGFNTETSSGMNIPQLESLKRMIPPDKLWPAGQEWNKVCTAGADVFNSPEPALNAVRGQFGEPESLESFVKEYHALDYDATRAMFEAFRCAVPRTTGIVQWMLNSAVPSLYWQLYDWYLVPTAAYYGVKKACAPLQLIYNYGDGNVYGVNDALPETALTAKLRMYDVNSRLILVKEKAITLAPRTPVKVFEDIKGPAFIDLRLLGANGKEIASNFYCLPEGSADYAWDKCDWWGVPIDKYPSFAFLRNMSEVAPEMETEITEKGWKVTLSNPSDAISYRRILKAFSKDGNLAPGVIWEDNFLSILPHQTVCVECTLPPGMAPEDVTIELDD